MSPLLLPSRSCVFWMCRYFLSICPDSTLFWTRSSLDTGYGVGVTVSVFFFSFPNFPHVSYSRHHHIFWTKTSSILLGRFSC
ncbi:hypothetical protein M758_UG034700 [Ceratodon purpureus]|nr:hypothetical protein M758_UG034700 [Ceratodon purpureus]